MTVPSVHPRATAPLRLAVIGCGPIGRLHAQAISTSPQGELIAVCDLDGARREAAAGQFGVRGYADVAELFAGQPLDAVTIATPDHLHVAPALAAIAAGCHVFCEKPLAGSVAEAEQLVAAAESHGVHLVVDYNRRFAFGYRTAKQLLDQGRIGKLDHFLLRVADGTPPPAVARHPHVIFSTLLTHHLDLARWYGGEILAVQAFAPDTVAGSLLRNVTLCLRYASGALATIVAGYRDGETRTAEWLELGGTTGSLIVEDMTRGVILCGVDPDQSQTFEPNPFAVGGAFYDSLIEHVRSFVADIARGAAPSVTGRDGLLGMKLAAAAVESLGSRTTIEV